jgi:hypothetical protein
MALPGRLPPAAAAGSWPSFCISLCKKATLPSGLRKKLQATQLSPILFQHAPRPRWLH